MNDQELAQFLAIETGKVLVEVRNEKRHKLSPRELGDAGDRAGHELLVHLLSNHRPLDHLLSEEGEDNKGRLSANRVWIVDPLDGTSHYSKGEADFAVHIALYEKGSDAPFEISAAAISIPAYELIHGLTAEKNVTNNDEIRILVSATRPPEEISKIQQKLEQTFGKTKLIAMGSVGAKLSSILRGNADLYINTGGFYEWDIAAPASVAKANGLSVVDINGKNLTFNNPDTFVPNVVMGKPEFVEVVLESLA